jgi:hypothetical protein
MENKPSPSLALEENPVLRFLPERTFCEMPGLFVGVLCYVDGMLAIVVDSVDGWMVVNPHFR